MLFLELKAKAHSDIDIIVELLDGIDNSESYEISWQDKVSTKYKVRCKNRGATLYSAPNKDDEKFEIKNNTEFELRITEALYNKLFVYHYPEGEIISSDDKINLFDVFLSKKEKYLESKNYDSGKKISISKLPWGNLGMTICYDLRFPFLYKKLAKQGAHFFSIPAAFTYTTGISHWESLLRARAIENGCYVFAPAQCGYHDNGR